MSVLSAIRPLVRSEEDLATLALAHVLRESAPAREAMNRVLAIDTGADWSAQQALTSEDSVGRPDLVARVGAEDVAFVEAKFSAGLTAAQPAVYLEALPEDGHLAMLVPTSRRGYISRELSRRAAAVGARLEASGDRSWEVVLPQGPSRRLSVLTWDDLVSRLLQATEGMEARAAHQDLMQIQHLIHDIEATLFVPFSSEELTSPTIPRVNIQVLELLRLLRDSLLESGWAPVGKYASTIDGWTGYTMRHPDRRLSWSLHQSWSAWLEYSATPLWLTLGWDDRLEHADLLRPWLSGPVVRGYHLTDWSRSAVGVPLFIPADSDRDQVVTTLLEQVENTAAAAEALLDEASTTL